MRNKDDRFCKHVRLRGHDETTMATRIVRACPHCTSTVSSYVHHVSRPDQQACLSLHFLSFVSTLWWALFCHPLDLGGFLFGTFWRSEPVSKASFTVHTMSLMAMCPFGVPLVIIEDVTKQKDDAGMTLRPFFPFFSTNLGFLKGTG
jgi:hypothetical protein